MLVVLFTIIIVFFFMIFNTKLFGKKINYMNIFEFIITFGMLLTSINPFSFINIENTLYVYYLITIIVFEITNVFFLSFWKSKKKKITIMNYNKIFLISLFVMISLIPYSIKGLSILMSYGIIALRAVALKSDYYSSVSKVFFTYILFPLNNAVLIYSIIKTVEKKKIEKTLIICLINILQNFLITGGRASLFNVILYFTIILYIKYCHNIKKIIINNLKIIIFTIALLIAILMITTKRSITSGESNILINIYTYFFGGFHLMQYHFSYDQFLNNNLLYGNAMFSPFIDTFKILFSLFHINLGIIDGVNIINNQVQYYFPVANNILMNNNVTYLYVCLRDFGIIGLLIGPFYISTILSLFYKMYHNNINNKCYLALYTFVLSNLFYLSFEFRFNITPVFYTIIFIYIIYIFSKKRMG